MTIYLNAASHGLPSDKTRQRMISYLQLEQKLGPENARRQVGPETEQLRADMAGLIGARAKDIGFSFTTTMIWRSLVDALDLKGRRVLIAPHEWGDNLRVLTRLAQQQGFQIEVLPPLDFAAPDPAAWAPLIRDDTAAVFIPQVSSIDGVIYPVAEIGALPRPPGCKLIVDAAQALGQVDIDVKSMGCDALVATCRKWLRGPRGTAVFWLNPQTFPDLKVNDAQPADSNAVALPGLANAVQELLEHTPAARRQAIQALSRYAFEKAQACGLQTLNGLAPQTGALALAIPGTQAVGMRKDLEMAGIEVKWPVPAVAEPAAADPGSQDAPSATAILRVAPHIYNTKADIDALFKVIAQHIR